MALKKQMELFEDGGLKDEGGTVDPESGNEVPVGSTQEEVRDDIPAQLSEGEFVLPADVVRYHGLDKIMALRDEAKMGLQRMEAMGQMGNSDEATIPDGVPFDINDLDIDDTLEYNQGGVVMQPGFTGIQSTQPSQFQNYQGQFVPYQPASVVPQAASQQFVSPTYVPPTQAVTPIMQQQQLPKFENFISTPTGAYDELREYKNAQTGEVRQIPFVGGQPIYPIPEGFVYVDPEATKTEEVTTTPTTVQTTRVSEKDGREPEVDTPGLFRTFDAEGKQTTFGVTSGTGTDIASLVDPMSKVSVGLDQKAINDLSAAGIDVLGIQNKTLGTQTKFSGPQVEALQPHLDRLAFQNTIKDVEKSDAFKDLASIIDDRSIGSKLKDAVMDTITGSTKSADYAKAVRELAVNIANSSDDQDERDNLANRVADMLRDPENQKTRTELGMDLAPVISGRDYDARETRASSDRARDVEKSTGIAEDRPGSGEFGGDRNNDSDNSTRGGTDSAGKSPGDEGFAGPSDGYGGGPMGGLNKGGDITKQMKKSGLTSKK